ncbi:MAG: hypothetical protein IJF37_07850 [Lachnospiraceae bacterium]|nr:hypothetical protein [Lachnospiraceae bacterium]
MDYVRRKKPFRHLGRVVDIINLILSAIVLVCAVLVAINAEKNMLLFPVAFMCTGLINLALAIKYYKRRETFKCVGLLVGFIAFMGFGIFSLIVVL